jgi:hypothetical protein
LKLPTNALTGQDAAVDWAASRRKLGLWLFGAPPLWSRLATDVERSQSVCIRLEPAPNAPEVVEIPSISFIHESALRACLRGVSCTHGFDNHTFLGGLLFKGKPQEAVGDSVDALARGLRPLTPTLPQVFELLDCYASVELLGKSENFSRELPAPRTRTVLLPSAELLELLASLASTVGISVGLKFRSPFFKLCLHPRQVPPEVELF